MFTLDQLVMALPDNLKNQASGEIVSLINNVSGDPVRAKEVRDNFISYSKVLLDGRYKVKDYLHAVTFVSHLIGGSTNADAYFRTFPDRYQSMLDKGVSDKDKSSYVSSYRSNKLVNKILEESYIPAYLLNRDIYQQAINISAEIMTDEEVSPKVRVEAANNLMTHLSKPKEAAALINLDMRDSSGMADLKKLLVQMAEKQVDSLSSGSIRDITSQVIMSEGNHD